MSANKSIISVENIWAEDLFKWFYHAVLDFGGDGGGAIVCVNYREVADWFVQWLINLQDGYYNKDNVFQERHEDENSITLVNNQECFIFTNDLDVFLFSKEYVFIVRDSCQFSGYRGGIDKFILPITKEQSS